MYPLLQRVLYRVFMHRLSGPVFIRTSGGRCRDGLVKCCCLLLVLQDASFVRSEEVGVVADLWIAFSEGGVLLKVLRLYCELSVSV